MKNYIEVDKLLENMEARFDELMEYDSWVLASACLASIETLRWVLGKPSEFDKSPLTGAIQDD